ncbi:hypothetical protein BVY04_03735, partial [bacterium M21]
SMGCYWQSPNWGSDPNKFDYIGEGDFWVSVNDHDNGYWSKSRKNGDILVPMHSEAPFVYDLYAKAYSLNGGTFHDFDNVGVPEDHWGRIHQAPNPMTITDTEFSISVPSISVTTEPIINLQQSGNNYNSTFDFMLILKHDVEGGFEFKEETPI